MPIENHVLLQRITLTQNASSVVLNSIPQTGYTDLKIVISGRNTQSAYSDGFSLSVNGGTAYSTIELYQQNGSISSYGPRNGSTYLFCGHMPSSSSSANTFGSHEIYISNYTSSGIKAVSIDGTTENNGTQVYQVMYAGRITNGTSISSITFDNFGYSFVAGSSFSIYGIANANVTPASAPKAFGGDIVKTDGTYWYHIFTDSGVFKPQVNLTCDYAVVAGGGGGGVDFGGGGGAGGYRTGASVSFTSASHTVVVGAGGGGGTRSNGFLGKNGSASSISGQTFTTIESAGGGGGGSMNFGNPKAGGSGGGGYGGYANMSGPGAAGNTPSTTPAQGYSGGSGYAPSGYGSDRYGGGGGGATAAGTNATSGGYGVGGSGATTSLSGTSTIYAAGGGGCQGQSFTATVVGAMATGNGGQGGGEDRGGTAGGSGIVIIRYLV